MFEKIIFNAKSDANLIKTIINKDAIRNLDSSHKAQLISFIKEIEKILTIK